MTNKHLKRVVEECQETLGTGECAVIDCLGCAHEREAVIDLMLHTVADYYGQLCVKCQGRGWGEHNIEGEPAPICFICEGTGVRKPWRNLFELEPSF